VTWSIVDQLAHQGGWDEALFVAVPVVVFGILLAVANHRANHRANRE
jgi:hypothetical protein